ncbi:MAG: acyl-CoA dehydrogenase [OM182 bacterium BACL3 MAG-120920-bin41]|jgi:alkylation response protein AidB-like acyl-CoA dehydrogenase|uniref:Acyl-CoA dehydrogenase n=4 Tax=OM182 clade TaxID=745002 RepID=A0A0R2S8M3_9GAMM|nr:MAG: acyl-CoA dehydrogenase [OM182 bacterium BACL3 MAG-120507-bin80]KRO83288.1 MAG: acyl-CoA dehydrogenase [OM182 bacterium BACL3 MAG-120619-bin3]KRO85131.1 MAG: acyl-CoA dehydrogenase [OM182 bacterium BACL3 MAG-120920-bin41]KRP30777.1 MAG: acyl-CoA dehydrogenase [OM182 bacterium BACL3 MAG-120924-bin41]
MSLVLSEDQQLLKDSAKAFVDQNAPVSVLRGLRDSKDAQGYDQNLWRQMLELGWAGMAIPEAYGGFEFGYGGLGVVLEESGRTLVSSPLIATVLLGASAINELGSDAQKSEFLPQVVSGELLLALAIDEKPHHRPCRIETSAVKSGEGYVLNGCKTFVLDGHIANKLVVVARTAGAIDDRAGLSVFLVDAAAEGVSINRSWMVDSRNSAMLSLNNVKVGADALLGAEGDAYTSLTRVLDIGRIGIAAEMLGSMQQAFEITLDYLKQREQFGVLIGSFQGLQHRAAEMYSEIELCKSAVRAALAALDDADKNDADIAEFASIAKAKLSEVATLVSNEAVQMHGGIGMTDEYDIGFYMKRARVAAAFLGDALFHRERYASLNGF